MSTFPINIGPDPERQRKLAEALMGNMKPIRHWSDGLANAGSQIAGAIFEKRADEAKAGQRAQNRDRMQQIARMLQGRPEETVTWNQPDEQGGTTTTFEARPPDYMGAMMLAAEMEDPQMFQLATGMQRQAREDERYDDQRAWQESQAAQQQANWERQFGLSEQQLDLSRQNANRETFSAPVTVAGANGEPMLVQIGNRGTIRPVDGYGPAPERPDQTDDQREYAAAVAQGYDGSFMDYMREMKEAGAAKTTVDFGGQDKFNDALGKNVAEQLEASRASAASAVDTINASARIGQLLSEGAITGFGAEPRLAIERGLKAAGLIDGERVTTTEQLMAELADNVLAKSAEMAGVLTDRDIVFLREAAAGNIAYDAQTIGRVAEIADKGARRLIENYNSIVAGLNEQGSLPGVAGTLYRPMTPPEYVPPPQTPGASGQMGRNALSEMSDDELLGILGVR